MNKWIAEFDLEDGDTTPEHMDLEYKGAKLDFHCRPMWIPVSERLPASDEDVLVTNGRGMYIGWIDPTDKIWRVDSESEYFMYDIVAWQPLPQPYKAESEG